MHLYHGKKENNMRANSFENLIADQKFKIQPADENISNYLLDCFSHFTYRGKDMEVHTEVPDGTCGRLEGKIKKATS